MDGKTRMDRGAFEVIDLNGCKNLHDIKDAGGKYFVQELAGDSLRFG
ncbi:hypothetical protein [Noviherbaspirillum galbum]|uniref:Uncharacterized protein n=1 Tax=Noviherbaspirillum galbum TaxID=2709383 RepID=A0A6B3SUU7_9BURK|nr:hypothetical protein [Noviherbaspirillum galbum]NEX64820.1 hypothetical protein [Noviherbaspirillum galbum]